MDGRYLNESQIMYEINKNRKEAKFVILEPVGFPIESSYIETPDIKVTNKELFEMYAHEQWGGYRLHKDQFIFDQKLIPDFAFRVADIRPDNSTITNNTSILVISSNDTKTKVTVPKRKFKIDDVIGQTKAKNKSRIITKYLEDPDKFKGWAPKNILFYGVPGTGKTMLAQALASELDVPIRMIKATSLIGDHVGDGANQIHDLYEQARQIKPCVIFIDEIDAIALERKYQSLRGDVTEIVNALLTEMGGIDDNESVITICATNNPNMLDYAFRSRFEEEIEFTLPNNDERRQIFKNYMKTLPVECRFNLEATVEKTKKFSGRDIKEKVLKVALHKAIIEDHDYISDVDVDYAISQCKKEIRSPADTMFT